MRRLGSYLSHQSGRSFYTGGDHMKRIVNLSAIVLFSVSGSALGETFRPDWRVPKTENRLPDHVFVPSGFDDNDHSQVVLSGQLPNSCYKVGKASARVDRLNKKIYISNRTYKYEGCYCMPVTASYSQVVDLGVIPSGSYPIVNLDAKNTEQAGGTITIAKAKKSAPDENTYAAIDQAFYEEKTPGKPTLRLTGSLPSDCMKLKEVEVVAHTPQVIEVLPKVEEVGDTSKCKNQKVSLKDSSHNDIIVELNTPWKGETLIHVRSFNGQSINKVVEIGADQE